MKKQPPKNQELSIRAAAIEVEDGAEGNAPVVRMSVSSETPVLSYVEINGEYQRAWEILDHSETSVDMSRCKDGLVVLDKHYGDQIGLMKVSIVDRKLGGTVEFCTGERAQELGADAAKGLRRNVSIGYAVNPASYRIEGDKDGVPVVRAMSWMVYEASFEPVPADPNVGVNRAATIITTPETAERKQMEPKLIASMYKRAAENGIGVDKVAELIEGGKTMGDLDALIVDKLRAENVELKTRKPDVPTVKQDAPIIGGDIETQAKVTRKYSLLNVLRRAAGDNKTDCGFEDEISQECRRLGMGSRQGGKFIVPHAVLSSRVLSVSGSSSATVATMLEDTQFIDVIRTKNILGPLGVQFLTGLVGNIAIPKMTAGATGYWVAENGDITGSQPTLGQVPGTPHTCGANVDITRLMLMQSTPSAEQFVRNEMLERIARTIQLAVFQGTGADGQPSAITAATGINNPSVTAGTPTYAEMLGFPGDILADSADVDGQKWAISGAVWKKLAATFTDGTAKAEVLLDWKSKTLLGFPYFTTQDVGTNAAFFGDFTTVVVGVWGAGVDLNLDTASLSKSGGLRIVALQDTDVMVRLGQALAYNAAVTN